MWMGTRHNLRSFLTHTLHFRGRELNLKNDCQENIIRAEDENIIRAEDAEREQGPPT